MSQRDERVLAWVEDRKHVIPCLSVRLSGEVRKGIEMRELPAEQKEGECEGSEGVVDVFQGQRELFCR